MVNTFSDTTSPAFDPTVPKPRGLLPVPPIVDQVVAREKARLRPYFTDEAEKRIRDDFTLQYYYEGQTVACRSTPEGIEVLAVGAEEIGGLVKGLTQEERLQIIIRQP